jgi:prephenate dehydrogenase
MNGRLGILGFGRFGRLVALHLKTHFDVVVYDRKDRAEEAADLGVRIGALREVASCAILVLCVPISRIEAALEAVAPHLGAETLVVDTCSVKEYPVALMERVLPAHVDILGTHPLFGPDSAADTLQGKKIVLCPVRLRSLRRVVAFLRSLKLDVMISSPESHDREMAHTQAIVQFLGRAFLEMGLTHETMATPGYERLIRILEVVQNDTWELFHDLQTFNRFAGPMRQRLIESLSLIDERLGG